MQCGLQSLRGGLLGFRKTVGFVVKLGQPRPRFGFIAQKAAGASDLRRLAGKRQRLVAFALTRMEIGQDQKQLRLIAEALAAAGQVEGVVEQLLGLIVLRLLDQDAGLAREGHDGGGWERAARKARSK